MDSLKIRMFDSYREERTYICKVVFNEFLGLEFTVDWVGQNTLTYRIECKDQFIECSDILFTTQKDQWLQPSLFPKLPLQQIEAPVNSFRPEIPVIYGSVKPSEQLTFADIDILGSIFFMLTRYEETGEHRVDTFGRYHHENSIFFSEKILDRPLVNEYLELLKHRLRIIYPSIKFKIQKYQVSLSHDVDVPITFNATWTDFLKKSLGDIYFRKSPGLVLRRLYGKLFHVFTGSFKHDPNNNFEFIMNEEDKAGIKGLFNFIPFPGTGPYDSNYILESEFIKNLLKRIDSREFQIGFHPGYQTFGKLEQSRIELHELNRVLSEIGLGKVSRGRQHYLRWTNPATWQIWNDLGLEEDGSVGYGMVNGFRASCCYKYSVFDLKNRRHLTLVEEPLIFMDVNSHVNTYNQSILSEIEKFSYACRFFNGNLTILYHNNYIISQSQRKLFSKILRIVV